LDRERPRTGGHRYRMSPPLDYAAWRRSRLGRVTEALELEAVLRAADEVSGQDVLDVGCGDGLYTVALARRGARVFGLDRSLPALRSATRKADEVGVRMRLAAGDAIRLPFADTSFELVVAVTVLCFVSSPENAIREVERVLRPGGRFVLGELGRWSTWAAWRRVRGMFGDRTWAGARFWTPEDLQGLMRGAGLIPGRVEGAAFYPPSGIAAAALAPLDPWLGRVTTVGAAFLVLEGRKLGRLFEG